MFLRLVIFVRRHKSTATTPEHFLATTTNDDARMPFWLSFVNALYPSFLVFVMLIYVPYCDE
jgi:hypothetical protein